MESAGPAMLLRRAEADAVDEEAPLGQLMCRRRRRLTRWPGSRRGRLLENTEGLSAEIMSERDKRRTPGATKRAATGAISLQPSAPASSMAEPRRPPRRQSAETLRGHGAGGQHRERAHAISCFAHRGEKQPNWPPRPPARRPPLDDTAHDSRRWPGPSRRMMHDAPSGHDAPPGTQRHASTPPLYRNHRAGGRRRVRRDVINRR